MPKNVVISDHLTPTRKKPTKSGTYKTNLLDIIEAFFPSGQNVSQVEIVRSLNSERQHFVKVLKGQINLTLY